jgi:hypothetical protein
MRGMSQLRQVKKSIAWKSGVVARSLISGGWHRFMDHSAQSKKIFQQILLLQIGEETRTGFYAGMQELDPCDRAWEKEISAWEKSGF